MARVKLQSNWRSGRSASVSTDEADITCRQRMGHDTRLLRLPLPPPPSPAGLSLQIRFKKPTHDSHYAKSALVCQGSRHIDRWKGRNLAFTYPLLPTDDTFALR